MRFVVTLVLVLACAAPAAGLERRSVPTVVAPGGAVLARVQVSGQPAWMQVDTGATRSVLDERFAARLRLPDEGEPVRTTTLGCRLTSQPVLVESWRVGAVELPPMPLARVKTGPDLETFRGLPIAGLLGNDVLRTFRRVTVDYVDRRLILGAPNMQTGRELAADGLYTDDGELELFTAYVDIGGRQLTFGIDTGASRSVFEAVVARELALPYAGPKLDVRALGCSTTARPIRVRRWKSGVVRLPAQRALAVEAGLSDRGLAGLLGAPALEHFGQVTFDYRRATVQLGFPLPDGVRPAPISAR